MLGLPAPAALQALDLGLSGRGSYPTTYVGVKAPMFSFKRLAGADPTLGVEMASTGEVACYSTNVHDALLKAYMSTLQFRLPTQKRVLVSIQEKLRDDFGPSFKRLHDLGFEILATEETAAYVQKLGLPCTRVRWPHEKDSKLHTGPIVDDLLKSKGVDFAFMFSNISSKRTEINYNIRRLSVDFGVPLITDIHVAMALTEAIEKLSKGDITLQVKTLAQYLKEEKQGGA